MPKKTIKKPKTKKPSRTRSGLFESFQHVSNVREGESLRFRDKNGRLTKFDGRKKLIAEVWLGNRRTNRVLNPTKKGQPIPQKFESRQTKRRQLFLRQAKQGPRVRSEPRKKTITIDSRFTIADNIESKCPEIGTDTVKFTKRGNGAYITIETRLLKDGEYQYFVSTLVLKASSPGYVYMELARYIIHRLYSNELRASSLKLSPVGRRANYVRAFKVTFTWDETKRLKEL